MTPPNAGTSGANVGILIVDDHPVFRQGIRHLLLEEDGLMPLGEAGSLREALRWLGSRRADVALLDHNLAHGVNGVDAIPQLLQVQPDLQIIMLTVCDDDEVFLRALRGGACGYLLKDAPPERIIEAIKAAAAGECRVSDSLVRTLFNRVRQAAREARAKAPSPGPAAPAASELRVSPRERQILEHLVKGMSNKEIAKALGISPNTVRNQLQKLQDDFQVRNRVQLALMVYELGVTPIASSTTDEG
ncbi:MAG: response regulator [Thiotrichales bacterium]